MLAPFLCPTDTTCHYAWGHAHSFSCLWSLTWKILASSSSRKTHTPQRFYKRNLKDTQWLSRYREDIFTDVVSSISPSFMLIFLPRTAGLAVEAVTTNVLLSINCRLFHQSFLTCVYLKQNFLSRSSLATVATWWYSADWQRGKSTESTTIITFAWD